MTPRARRRSRCRAPRAFAGEKARPSAKVLRVIFNAYDVDGSGSISFEEFVDGTIAYVRRRVLDGGGGDEGGASDTDASDADGGDDDDENEARSARRIRPRGPTTRDAAAGYNATRRLRQRRAPTRHVIAPANLRSIPPVPGGSG